MNFILLSFHLKQSKKVLFQRSTVFMFILLCYIYWLSLISKSTWNIENNGKILMSGVKLITLTVCNKRGAWTGASR